jgi:ABC-type transport system involved in multi-copper enzyme maturation permease subunit
MLRKEFRDALHRLLECLVLLVAVPLGYFWDRAIVHYGWRFADIVPAVFTATIFLFAVYAGISLFSSEKKDRALEYLLSLPVSRSKIVLAKIIPRLSILVGLWGGFAFLAGQDWNWITLVFLLFLFFVAASLSIAIDSAVIGVIGVLLLFAAFDLSSSTLTFIAWKLSLISSIHMVWIGWTAAGVLILGPFAAAFLLVIRNLQAMPLRLQMRPYYRLALPSFLAVIFLILKFFGAYLAAAGRLG